MQPFAFRTLSSRITLAMAFFAVLAVTIFAAFVWFAALKADEEGLRKERLLMLNGLSALVATVPREQGSFSVWDEAVTRTARRDHIWVAENFGGWMHDFFGHDRSYILDARNDLVFAAHGGEVIRPARFDGDRAEVESIVLRLRDRLADRFDPSGMIERLPRSDIFAADILQVDGQPAIVSARPILPHTDRLTVADGGEYVFVAVKNLDQRSVDMLARQFRLSELTFQPAQGFTPTPASVRIASQEGATIGYLSWSPGRPGVALMKEAAPWASLALLLFAGIGFYQARSLRRTSRELHASESRARHLAYHDLLTGLPNRGLFEERLDALLRSRRGCGVAVLFLDLDRFKSVNDTLGHLAGDALMRQAAARLEEAVGGDGIIARVGGDEFAIAVADNDAPDAAKHLSETLLSFFAAPFHLDEDMVHVGVSIGVATAPEAGNSREELLRKADIALYEAKKRGRGCCQFFSEAMDEIVKQRKVVEEDLRKALAGGDELQLVYQPLRSAEGTLTGAEALLRWNHPVHRTISPMFVVTIAEEYGLIMQLGDWVLHEACRMAARVPVPWIAVNISPMQLRDPNFAHRCLDIIAQHKIEPRRIQVEITEAVVIEDPELAGTVFRTLRAAGIRVALDDFGTGYSSMSYLQNYPLDRLKIDRFFVRALGTGEEGRAIVAAMIDMARALKLEVTAEGVETHEQHELLKEMGCNEMQGYLFSGPVSASVFARNFFPGVPRSTHEALPLYPTTEAADTAMRPTDTNAVPS